MISRLGDESNQVERAISTGQLTRVAALSHPAYRRGGLPRLFKGELVLRLVSRLDAFSGYPFRI